RHCRELQTVAACGSPSQLLDLVRNNRRSLRVFRPPLFCSLELFLALSECPHLREFEVERYSEERAATLLSGALAVVTRCTELRTLSLESLPDKLLLQAIRHSRKLSRI